MNVTEFGNIITPCVCGGVKQMVLYVCLSVCLHLALMNIHNNESLKSCSSLATIVASSIFGEKSVISS
jgi:hypothetical protein